MDETIQVLHKALCVKLYENFFYVTRDCTGVEEVRIFIVQFSNCPFSSFLCINKLCSVKQKYGKSLKDKFIV